MDHCPHDGVEILDEDWWYCRDCGDAGPYIETRPSLPVPVRRRRWAGVTIGSTGGKRYYCPDCGQVVTVWSARPPERVPVHGRWRDGGELVCAASRRPAVLEKAP